ncbi:MAG: hypothetical protein ACQES9_09180, partial [Myxococcota bacterium]
HGKAKGGKKCRKGYHYDSRRRRCVKDPKTHGKAKGGKKCRKGYHYDSRKKRCIKKCTGGKKLVAGRCRCPSGTVEKNGKCKRVKRNRGRHNQRHDPQKDPRGKGLR